MWVVRIILLFVLAVLTVPASGQAKVLKGDQITREALLADLVPRPMTRSIGSNTKPSASIMIMFETNSAELTEDSKKRLGVVGQALNDDQLSKFSFMLEGHADPRGTPDLNQRLSEERAESVRQYLVQSRSVGVARLKSIGKGDREPLNTTNPAAPENRRVTIITEVQ